MILIHMVLSGVWWQNGLPYTYYFIMFYFITANWNNCHWDNSFWIKSRTTTNLLWKLQAQQTGPWNRSNNYAGLSRLAPLWKFWPLKQSHTLQLLSSNTYTVHQTGKAGTRELWLVFYLQCQAFNSISSIVLVCSVSGGVALSFRKPKLCFSWKYWFLHCQIIEKIKHGIRKTKFKVKTLKKNHSWSHW